MQITKFKVKGDWEEIQVSYELPPEDTEKKTVNYVCKERPRNELIIAFDNLMEHVRIIVGLKWETGIGMIRAIAFKETEDGLMMAITAQNDDDYKVKVMIESFYPTGELLEKVEEAIAYLEKYIMGDRALPPLIELLAKSEVTVVDEEKEMVSALGF